MTGTTDLSINQLDAITSVVEADRRDFGYPTRVVIHPDRNSTVRVEFYSISSGSVVVGTRIIGRDGEIMTVREAEQNGYGADAEQESDTWHGREPATRLRTNDL